ncbi:MAG: Tm-1-like ATP-binding domain-containing protein [Saprospiraceae bacterium]|nr:Tm-1-like ATP-binding domain-containing protein [Saprospiraceae bacterium]
MIRTKAYVIGTFDTKGDELLFVCGLLQEASINCCTVDVSTRLHQCEADISANEVASYHPERPDLLSNNDGRGDAVSAMSEALELFLISQTDVGGVLGLGGSGGTSLITRSMRKLPIGLPKLMVSTVASGNVRPYVGESDIFMLYSVTDIAGINQISSTILGQAAHAMVGMMSHKIPDFESDRTVIGLTMFGVTTTCVERVRSLLSDKYECLIFHATGTGGRSMEKLIDSGFITGVIDLTTTEICDLLMGGVLSAGEERMDSIIRTKVPYIVSVGALDMVNFGPLDTVPQKYHGRNLYQHNPQVTLVRTTPQENKLMAEWIAIKLNAMEGPVRLILPENGVSALSVEGQPFHDPEADRILFETLADQVITTHDRQIIRLPYAINDPDFAEEVADTFMSLHSNIGHE